VGFSITLQAVFESTELKHAVFRDLETYCKPDCILATNTSTILVEEVGAKTTSKHRIAGAHFFR
jgi:3-hydroxyacyl-CoA dehydrogenase